MHHEAEKSWARMPAAACAVVSAAAHVPLIRGHLQEAPYVGVLFIGLVVVLDVVAVLLLVADRPSVWRAAFVTPALTVVAYVLSRTVGLPEMGDDVGNWTEPLGVVAVTAEVCTCLLVLLRPARLPRSVPRLRPSLVAAALLALGVAATGRAAAVPESAATVTGQHAMSGMASTGSGYWDAVAGEPGGGGKVRQYYISADPVVWDYAPGRSNLITAEAFDEDEDAKVFVGSGPGRIGSRYVKCLYREYPDAAFRHPVARPAEDAYLGMLGPVLRAEVGDTIRIVFRNACPFPASMHPHGVFYDKSSEGAPYADGTRGARKVDDAVPTGQRHTYVWKVPGRAGPGPGDGSSVMWMYHSHTDEIADTYAGLIGPMVVTGRGQANPDGSPADVDRELFMSFFIDNETLSPLLKENMRRFGTPPMPKEPGDDEGFVEHNLKHSVNGYLYGTMPMVDLRRGEHVRWYVMAMGTEVDLHTPHWHGNDVVVNGMRMDVVSLLPAGMLTADMVPDNKGTWLFHCHVNDHLAAGMLTRYRLS